MGGAMVFDFQEQRITLLHNRDNWDERSIEAAEWDDDMGMSILGGWCNKSDQNRGVWIGVSKEGRFGCLIDSTLHDDVDDHIVSTAYGDSPGPSSLPVSYLLSQDTPEEFAHWLVEGMPFVGTVNPTALDPDPRDLTYTYELIVGDISTSTIMHISKPVKLERALHTRRVPYGVHTLSLSGLDNPTSLKDTRLRALFEEHIGSYEKGETSLEELTQKVLGDRMETVPGDEMSSIFVETTTDRQRRYGTTSSTAFVVKRVLETTEEAAVRALEGTFYELCDLCLSGSRKVQFPIHGSN